MAHPILETMLKGQDAAAAAKPRGPALYFARVDAHLAGLTEAERLPFLRAELVKWEARYRVFQRAVARGDEDGAEASAFEYVETITKLAGMVCEREQVTA